MAATNALTRQIQPHLNSRKSTLVLQPHLPETAVLIILKIRRATAACALSIARSVDGSRGDARTVDPRRPHMMLLTDTTTNIETDSVRNAVRTAPANLGDPPAEARKPIPLPAGTRLAKQLACHYAAGARRAAKHPKCQARNEPGAPGAREQDKCRRRSGTAGWASGLRRGGRRGSRGRVSGTDVGRNTCVGAGVRWRGRMGVTGWRGLACDAAGLGLLGGADAGCVVNRGRAGRSQTT